MGSLERRFVVVALAVVLAAVVAVTVTWRSSPGDVIASPTTLDQGPDALALDAPDDAEPFLGDDATWMPTTERVSSQSTVAAETASGSTTTSASGTSAGGSSAGDSSGEIDLGPAVGEPSTAGTSSSSPVPTTPSTDEPSTAAPATTGPATTGPATPSSANTSTTVTSTTSRGSSVGFAGVAVEDFTNSNANVTQDGQDGSFRTVCTVSHFNFDDAIVFPGQRDATHLHMYFGNTLADFSSTGDSLASSGDASCQGGPLNRSAYWVPAVLDQNGDVRPAQYMLAYYKRAGDEDVVPYPNGLEMVVGNAMAMSPQPGREQPIGAGVDYSWSCGSPITVGKHEAGRLIPDCSPGEFLTLSLIFPRCGDGRLESADNKSHMAYPAAYGASCPASHPIRHPQLTYNIHWNNNDTNTGDWYLSSDDHRPMGGMLMAGGTTTHADWIGAWHPDVLDIMTSGCFNADHDCKGGTISPTLRLDFPNVQGFSPSNIYDSNVAPTVIPLAAL